MSLVEPVPEPERAPTVNALVRVWLPDRPGALGLVVVWAVLARAYRSRFERDEQRGEFADQPYVARETWKGVAVLAVLVLGLLACPLPREVQAMAAGAAVLVSRRQRTHALLSLVDWPLLVLFAGLYRPGRAARDAAQAAVRSGTGAGGQRWRDP